MQELSVESTRHVSGGDMAAYDAGRAIGGFVGDNALLFASPVISIWPWLLGD